MTTPVTPLSTVGTCKIDLDSLINRIIILYGETETGKSTIIKHILKVLEGFVQQGFVISPMDRANNGFRGMFPLGLIYYDVTEESMMMHWERQKAMVLFWREVNKIKTLLLLVRRVDKSTYRVIKSNYKKMKNKLNDYKKQYPENVNELQEMTDDHEQLIIFALKQVIMTHYSDLYNEELTPDEANSLEYLNFNPRAVWIFDDCTDIFNTILTSKKSSFLVNMMTMARHNQVTVIIGLHHDKCLAPEYRKAAHLAVFTTQESALAYFTRESNSFSRDLQKKIIGSFREIFSVQHQVAIWKRKDRKLYKFKAKKYPPFEFCSSSIFEFFKPIEIDSNSSCNNEFSQKLRIKPKMIRDKLK